MHAFTRRHFVLSAGGGLALLAVLRCSGGTLPPPWPWSARGLQSAVWFGERYLRRHPEEQHRLASTDAACRSSEGRRHLARAVREDFASGRVAQVEGWVLARTEARLCGLAWVLDGERKTCA